MYLKRKSSCGEASKCVPFKKSNSLFTGPTKLLVVRKAPLFGNGITKGFQRPMMKRRAYNERAETALKMSSLGPKRRMNGMAKLLARAGRGLSYKLPEAKRRSETSDTESSDSEDESKEPEKPFEPLMLWRSPHQGGEPKGLPSKPTKIMRPDEYGVEEEVTVLQPAPLSQYATQNVYVPPVLTKWLRPHQREGVQFLYECVMGLKDFDGRGVILADDMGLGKTLQSVTLIYTLLKTSITKDPATCKRVIVVCPCSLVKNWSNEFVKWLGPGTVKALALAEGDRKTIEKNIDTFVNTKMFNVLIASYECIRTHIKRLTKKQDCCDLLVCDEAHRLKNNENQTTRALNSLPVRRRVLLTGTPMQNDLQEFYAMVDFTNPGILGTPESFRKRIMFPILRGREPDATETQKRKMMELQAELSEIVEQFILRRINTVNAEHLPPKLVQVVCCNLTDIQANMYQHLVNSKATQHMLDGKQVNCLASIQMLMKLCNHPSLVVEEDRPPIGGRAGRKQKQISYSEDDKPSTAAPGADGIAKFLPYNEGRGHNAPVHPEWSGKMFVLYKLMKEMRKPGNGNDKIVIISNYTQTLDLIGKMCRENSWGFCRLDGSVTMKKRQKMVDEFNDPSSSLVAFLLSSKAGGCGLNLIGGNRLVLFDPDWNPAVDKQAAARCWRDGQKKRCFTYRFLATGTVEEKIFQRQLSKEGLQSVVDDKEQVNTLSTKDLRNLFKLRTGTPSDTHDKLQCKRCEIIHDTAELEAQTLLPRKLGACKELLEDLKSHEDAQPFLTPLDATQYGKSKEEYEKLVKQPMDFASIEKKLDNTNYDKPTAFSKDVNRIFSNVAKVWDDGDPIMDASKRLQTYWMIKWTDLVPKLMAMKADAPEAKESSTEEADDPMLAAASFNNERGDDYQEQIGMPDEENMRSWSHHYSTDTVDDPVFRAAMRNTDAVSFVFGLEVTWSLIQQKQQEEEERAALEALEHLDDKEVNPTASEGDDNEEDSDTDDDKSKAEPPKSKKKAVGQKPKVTTKRDMTDSNEEEDSEDDDDDGEEMNDFIVDDGSDEQSDREAESEDDEMEDDDEKNSVVSGTNAESKIDRALPDSDDDEEEGHSSAKKRVVDGSDSGNSQSEDIAKDAETKCSDDENAKPLAKKKRVVQDSDSDDSDSEDVDEEMPDSDAEVRPSPVMTCFDSNDLKDSDDEKEPKDGSDAMEVDDTAPGDVSAGENTPKTTLNDKKRPIHDLMEEDSTVDKKRPIHDLMEEDSTVDTPDSEDKPLTSLLPENNRPHPSIESSVANNLKGWTCATCTYFNSNRKRKCEMCATKKPSKGQSD